MDIDTVLEAANPLGWTQWMIVLSVMLMNIETGFTVLNGVFLGLTPPHHCANHSGLSLEESVPVIDGVYSKCEEYANPQLDNETRVCSNWEFDTTTTGKTFVTEWSLVCSKDVLPSVAQTVLLAGFGIGSLIGGPMADRYGRRPTIIASLILFNVVGLAVSLSQSFAVFVALRFFMGAIFKGIRIPVMNLLFESLVPRHRPLVGILPTCLASVGLMIMAGLAYSIRNWRFLNVALMVPTIIIMGYSWFLPESVRWLLSQNKTDEAENAMQKIAAFNKVKSFPSPALNKEDRKSTEEDAFASEKVQAKRPMKASGPGILTQVFRPPTVIVTVILAWSCITYTLTYFGFALSTGRLAGSPYLNFFISSSADLIGFFLATFLIKRFGTIKLAITGLTSSAATLIIIIIIDYTAEKSLTTGILVTVFAFLGRFLIAIAIQPIILMTSDCFPTTVRNTGTAIVQFIGNIGSIIAPQLLYLNKYIPNLAFMVMACCCLISSLLIIMLPETVGSTQPQTSDDLQKLFNTRQIIRFGRNKNGDADPIDIPELKSL